MKMFCLCVALVLLLVPVLAICQTDEEIFEEFQFNFATPGARAAAMGRAFIGLADDATAAQTNPAGLVILTKPEISFEVKSTSYDVERAAASDSLTTGKTSNFGQSITSPSFFSVVYPHARLRLAFFRQEFLNYEEQFALAAREVVVVPGNGVPIPVLLAQSTGSVDFLGVNWGGALAYQLSPKAYAGVSIKASQLDTKTLTTRLVQETPTSMFQIDQKKTALSVTAGILLNPSKKFSLGAIYEKNAKFEYTEHVIVGQTVEDFPVTIKVPDRFGVGVAIKPTEQFTILSDIILTQYSQITDHMQIIAFKLQGAQPKDFKIDNATEFHAGVEYVFFSGNTLIAVRGGVFTNPAHDLKYVGQPSPGDAFALVIPPLFNFGKRETEVGETFGGGLVISDSFQVDAAYLISKPFNEFSTSFVIRF